VVSFVYVNGVFTRIDTFPGVGVNFSQAFGINDAGLVVGTAFQDTGTSAGLNAFVYDWSEPP
jgi:probable HAF family extracellular repeat protein